MPLLSAEERRDIAEYVLGLYRRIIPVEAIPPDLGGRGEARRAAVIEEEMRRLGLRVHRYDARDDRAEGGVRPNLVAVVSRGVDEARMLWIIAHMDTVPAGPREAWSHPPFEVSIEGGRVYGRGVEDDGQGIAIALAAARHIASKGEEPRIGLGIAVVSDEEAGSKYGLLHLLHEGVFDKHGAPENYFLVPDAGSPDGSRLIVAEKHIVQLRVTVRGKQAHASMPHTGVNAHREGMRFNLMLDEVLRSLLSGVDELYDPPVSTCEPTRKDKNIDNINTIPGLDVVYWDCRLLPSVEPSTVINAAKSAAYRFSCSSAASVDVEAVSVDKAGAATSPDHPFVKGFARALREVRGVEPRPVGIGGGTVARYLRRMGYPAIAWMTCRETAHQPDEYVVLDDVVSDVETVLHYLLETA